MKKLVATSYAIALVIVSSMILQIPIWVPLASFGYYTPTFIAEIILGLPLLLNTYIILSTMSINTFEAHLLILTSIICAITIVGFAFWIASNILKAWLIRRDPWFASVI